MKDTVKNRVEKYFNMPFEKVISELHFKNGKSLNALSLECGESRQVISSITHRMGIKTRSHKDAVALTKNKGENHWNFGRDKNTCEFSKAHSERMTNKNAIRVKGAAEKRAVTISKTFVKKLLPQEKVFRDILLSVGVSFEMQRPVGKFNLDFFIPDLNLAIEIDSTDKWGVERRSFAEKRDAILLREFNIKTLRINKRFLSDSLYIRDVLYTNNIIF